MHFISPNLVVRVPLDTNLNILLLITLNDSPRKFSMEVSKLLLEAIFERNIFITNKPVDN